MKPVYSFSTPDSPEIAQVGGKAFSLIQMTEAGLRVPPGFVLSVGFFEPWIDEIKSAPEWFAVANLPANSLKTNSSYLCSVLKERGMQQYLNAWQKTELSKAFLLLKRAGEYPLLAVRSSSPEEDLEGASFAGGYETILGATEETIEAAIKKAFVSCLDERVFLYKQEHGYPIDQPRIAVIVQQLIPGEISGVAFSLNPVNNCYDQAVINANYGLGESVVAGQVSPDSFVVDKVSGEILEKTIGKKETSIWANLSGGTHEAPAKDRDQACLSNDRVSAVVELVIKTEALYGKPIDIEWTIANDQLYLLQARPITTYVPLPEEMLTEPGAERTLYIDITMYKQGINQPMSVMGLEYWERAQKALAGTDELFGGRDGLMLNLGGRTYSNMSLGLKLQDQEKSANVVRAQDALSAEIIADVDDSYIAKKLPKRLLRATLEIAIKRFGTVFSLVKVFKDHKDQHRAFIEEISNLEQKLHTIASRESSLETLADDLTGLFADFTAEISLPITIRAEMARSRIKKLFRKEPPEVQARIAYLERALPNNVTIEMGLALYQLSQFDEIKECPSAEAFIEALNQGMFSAEFQSAWDAFLKKFGMRCPMELDLATPRFSENPKDLFNQMCVLATNVDQETNPQSIYEKGVADREAAYDSLLDIVEKRNPRTAKKFQELYDILVTIGGYRETLKYYLIITVDLLRKRVLSEAEKLYAEGRLENIQDVFSLKIKHLDNAIKDPEVNIAEMIAENTQFYKKIAHVRNFPLVIDSRGLILRAPKKETKEGEFVGQPISVGVVRGKAKTLNHPDDKPVYPGEILIARATDPGWTPLFINAAGVILEIGGVLQHGALVAREYGKPCVAGIENVTQIFEDGQMIEVDGANGIVRKIDSL
ncbi:PEP/pyruvate-binding domain-containing protein [Chloroflexota bacterium]